MPPRISEPILRIPQSPREILLRYDIGPSQLDGFFHGQPLDAGEEDVLARILFRFPRLALENVERWRKKDITWDQLAAAPNDWRAEFFAVRGRAKRVEKHSFLPEIAELFEFDHYFRVTIDLDDSPFQALVCTRFVPSVWKVGEEIDEPAACDGLFLKLGDPLSEEPQIIFAARRVAWFPDRDQPEHFLGPDQLALASWGLDIGLLEVVRTGNGKAIGDTDREAFYQMLAALGRADPQQLHRPSAKPIDVVPLLEGPQKLHGQFMPVQGIARRVLRVPVSDPDVRVRFGIDHYYEIDISLPLGDKSLQFGKDSTGEKNPVYANHYPATLICRRLPPGIPEGDNTHDQVRADAVFFKIWSYRSGYSSKFKQLQPAPLFLAIEPELVKFESPSTWVTTILVGSALGLALFVIVLTFLWFRQSDKIHAQQRRTELLGPGGKGPDFSGLGAAPVDPQRGSEP